MSTTPTAEPPAKADAAFRTIGELADDLGLPQHILRYWETRFVQLRPLQRAGKRRYYRPADVALARRIDRLLNHEGYTIRGVQKLLDARVPDEPVAEAAAAPVPPPVPPAQPSALSLPPAGQAAADVVPALVAIRRMLAEALGADRP